MKPTRILRILTYACALLLLAFTIAPVAWAFLSSLIGREAMLMFPPDWFHFGLTLDHYIYIFTGQIPTSHLTSGQMRSMISPETRQVPAAVLNSFAVAFAVMFANLLLGAPAAYAYARLRFPGRTGTFFFITLSRLIPTIALAMPYYLIIQSMGLLNTHLALILIYTVLTLPFTILILTLYFRGIPAEIEEAAQLDGCGAFGTLLRVTIPLSLPSLIGTGLFAFMIAYSEFLFGLLITTSIQSRTLSVLLGMVSWSPDVTWSLLSSSIVIGIIPTLILVFPVYRYMVRGLIAGGVS